MKNTLTLILMILSVFVFGQEQLVVDYEMKITMDASQAKSFAERELFTSFNGRIENYQLITSKDYSTFKKIDKVNNSQKGASNFTSSSSSGYLYKDLMNRISYAEMSIENKNFTVKDTIKRQKWNLVKEEIDFLGYKLKKATQRKGMNEITAWYTTELPYRNGPFEFGELPGLILKIDYVSIVPDFPEVKSLYATNISVESDLKVVKPNRYKEVSKKEYDAFVKEAMKLYSENDD